MSIEAVIFDWGGTLSRYADIDLVDMWRLAARHLAPDREEEVCSRLTDVEAACFDRVHTDQRSFTLAEVLRRASEELGLDVAEAVLEEAAVRHLDSWTTHVVHEPEARPVLAGLKARGLKIGLLSNTHWPETFHEHFLERDGLVELIDARLYTSTMVHMKPHREAFEAAMAALELTAPSRAVFVGDRPYDDILGASRVGMRTVLRRNPAVPPFEVEPDATIERLGELPAIVERWLRA